MAEVTGYVRTSQCLLAQFVLYLHEYSRGILAIFATCKHVTLRNKQGLNLSQIVLHKAINTDEGQDEDISLSLIKVGQSAE